MSDTPHLADSHPASPSRGLALGTRWLGVGLASCIAVSVLWLWSTGRIGLYINPDAAWWAVSMSVVVLIGAVASCAVPVHDEEHEHVHHDEVRESAREPEPVPVPEPVAVPTGGTRASRRAAEEARERAARQEAAAPRATGGAAPGAKRRLNIPSLVASVGGGALASVFVVGSLILAPASLSAELSLERSTGGPPQLPGSSTITLASTADTSEFGVGEWSSLIATTTDPAGFIGSPATLVGFVGDGDLANFDLTRLVIVHCVIDAQAATVPVVQPDQETDVATGEWVQIDGTMARDAEGALVLQASTVTPIDEPEDPYEH